MADFKAEYGYDLGVPVNWSAYEDIAEFFTGRDQSHLGVEGEVYGNMDYGKKDPSLGWRYTDAWMSMAGHGRRGRAERPAGRRMGHSCERKLTARRLLRDPWRCHQLSGGGLCRRKAIEWLQNYSPPEAAGMTFSEPVRSQRRAMSPSRCSGTPPSPPTWSSRACR
jgi:glycerol transport system substrate-binding protein